MPDSEAQRPIPTRASKDSIHRFAEEIAGRVALRPGAALEPIVTRFGGTITYQALLGIADSAPPSIYVEDAHTFTIVLPSTTSPQRNRFTIAHELGHLFLHFPMIQRGSRGAKMIATRWVDEHDADQRRAEWEANWFAAGLLMPQGRFLERAAAVNYSQSVLCEEFDVSAKAVEIRAANLGIPLA